MITVYRRLLADTETAIGLYAKLAENRPGTYLLESAEQGVWSRYSFIGVRAAATLTERDGEAVWTGQTPTGLPAGGDPLAAVRETLRRLHTPRAEGLPPFTSGLVGYLSYDAVRRVERLPDSNPDDLAHPRAGLPARLRPGRARPPRRRGVAGRQRDQLRRQRRAGRRGVRRRRGPGRGDDRRGWPSPPRRRSSRPTFDGAGCRSAGSAPRRSSRGRWRRRWRRSGPARRSRSWSASGSRSTPPPTPSTSTGCCG